MNIKKTALDLFARIWACWGLVSFIATFLLIFIPSMIAYFIPDPAGQRYFIFVSRIWMRIWLPLVGCPVSIKGRENFVKGRHYIVLFNHNAFLDVPLSAPFVPGANKTIAKSSFARVPLFGLFYSKGSILVNRKDEKSRSKSFEAMKQVLGNGMHMCIYPEGTRNRTGRPLKEFYDGAFKLAVATKKEIIPCIITGTRKAMPINRSFYLLPVRLKMQFLEPIPSVDVGVEELKKKTFDLMWDNYVKLVEKVEKVEKV